MKKTNVSTVATNHSFRTNVNAQLITEALAKLQTNLVGSYNVNVEDKSNKVATFFGKTAIQRVEVWLDVEAVVFFVGHNVSDSMTADSKKKLLAKRDVSWRCDDVESKIKLSSMKEVATVIALLETVDIKKLETLNAQKKQKKAEAQKQTAKKEQTAQKQKEQKQKQTKQKEQKQTAKIKDISTEALQKLTKDIIEEAQKAN